MITINQLHPYFSQLILKKCTVNQDALILDPPSIPFPIMFCKKSKSTQNGLRQQEIEKKMPLSDPSWTVS